MFEIKSYSRKELAILYFPNSTPATASVNLKRWLKERKGSEEFMERINRKKILTKSDVKEIVNILGEP